MLYKAFFTLIVAIMCNSAQGCHSGLRKRSLSRREQAMTSFFSRCLSDSAGKDFRWQAITKFAIEDTAWYDNANRQFCRGIHDTGECWIQQIDYFVSPHAIYSKDIKRCIQEYASRGSRFVPEFAFDESLQKVRSGRRKRAVFGHPWFHYPRIVRQRFVPPIRTTRVAAVPHYVPPRRTGYSPLRNPSQPPQPVNRNPAPSMYRTYYRNRRVPIQPNSRGTSPHRSTTPVKSTRTPTARSQTSQPRTATAKFTDLSRYDQIFSTILRDNYRRLVQQTATPVLPTVTYHTQHVVPQTSSIAPFLNGRGCDFSRSRFEGCVSTAVDVPIEPQKRSLLLNPETALTKEDLKSIFRFFKECYSPCMDEQTNAPVRICGVTQVRSYSASAKLCLPSIMVRLVKRDSELRRLFVSCAPAKS